MGIERGDGVCRLGECTYLEGGVVVYGESSVFGSDSEEWEEQGLSVVCVLEFAEESSRLGWGVGVYGENGLLGSGSMEGGEEGVGVDSTPESYGAAAAQSSELA